METLEVVAQKSFSSTARPSRAPDGFKSILFHVHKDDNLENRLQIALSIARGFGAHLHLLHVNPIEAYTVHDAFGTFVSPQIAAALEEEGEKLQQQIAAQLAKEDVSWDYEEVTGLVTTQLIQRAALSDLLITGREPHERELGGPAVTLIGDLLEDARTPIFITGDEVRDFDLFGRAIVAWNGSYEAALALKSAVPLLRLAANVKLVQVEEAGDNRFPSTRALEYLSGHGVHAEFVRRINLGEGFEDALIDQAIVDGASYMVMGGYSHSRAGEFFFGGVTRSVLKSCPINLLLAH